MSEVTDTDLAWSPPPFPAKDAYPASRCWSGSTAISRTAANVITARSCALLPGSAWSRRAVNRCISACSLTALAITSMPISVELNHH